MIKNEKIGKKQKRKNKKTQKQPPNKNKRTAIQNEKRLKNQKHNQNLKKKAVWWLEERYSRTF